MTFFVVLFRALVTYKLVESGKILIVLVVLIYTKRRKVKREGTELGV